MISKTAKKYESYFHDENTIHDDTKNSYIKAILASLGLGVAIPKSLVVLLDSHTKNKITPDTPPTIQKAVEKYAPSIGLDPKEIFAIEIDSPLQAMAQPRLKTVFAHHARPEILNHELGHVAGKRWDSNLYKGIQGVSRLGVLTSGLAAFPAALGSVRKSFLENRKDDLTNKRIIKETESSGNTAEKIMQISPFVAAPTLIEEGIASGKALNNIRKVDGVKPMLKSILPLTRAFSTYLGAAMTPFMAYHFAKKFQDKHYNDPTVIEARKKQIIEDKLSGRSDE